VRFGLALFLLGILGWLYDEPAFYQALRLPAPHIGAALADANIAVLLFDVVLGYGAHSDPACPPARRAGRQNWK